MADELEIKKGFPFYCAECNKFYRWKQLKEKMYDLFIAMTCPKCGDWVEDLKQR